MRENYPSASEMVRNLAGIHLRHEVVKAVGHFRIVKFVTPYWDGSEYWVVNEKGFLWEPADTLADAEAYLDSDEARAYNAT